MAGKWRGETRPMGAASRPADLYVDALFGAGLSKPLSSDALRFAQASQTLKGRVVAIDVPSGVSGDSSQVLGDAAIRADLRSVRIIHGKGTGALRDRVSEMLRKDTRVKSFRLGLWNEGGSGVTIAEF